MKSQRFKNFSIGAAMLLPVVSLVVVSFFGTGLDAAPAESTLSFDQLQQRVPSPFQQSLGLASVDNPEVASSDEAEDTGQILGETTQADQPTEEVAPQVEQPEDTEVVGVAPTIPIVDPVTPTEPDTDDDDDEDIDDDDEEVVVLPVDPTVCDPAEHLAWQELVAETEDFWADALANENDRHEEVEEEIKALQKAGLNEESIALRATENKLNKANLAQIADDRAAELLALSLQEPEICDEDN